MPITEAQRTRRKTKIGASDMAAVLGLDPWRSAYDVWLEKTADLEDLKENAAMQAGSLFEDGVLNWAGEQLGRKLIRNQYRTLEGTPLASNCDAIVDPEGTPLEAKTTGLFGPVLGEWGEDGSDHVPDRYIIQTHVQMLCTGSKLCHLAAFIGGRGFAMFELHFNHQVADIILEQAQSFWQRVHEVDPPDDSKPNLEVLKRIRRRPQTIADIDPDLAASYLDATERLKQAEKEREQAQAALLAAMGDAEGARFGGERIFTYLPQRRRTIDSKSLRQDHPELAEQYERETEYRVLRLSKA